MIVIFYIFAFLLIFLSYRSFRSGIDYLNYFQRESAQPPSNFTPFATIIAPCKGLDEGIRENFAALFEQNYPAYEVIFVTDDENDPSVPVIKDRLGQHKNAKLIIAAKASNTGQKVVNLREAVLHADDASEAFVFVDSDARPAENWLRHLVAPLADNNIGAATGYRWFFSKRMSLWSELLSVWNASIASALGANERTNFCWGGSTALRRDIFEKIDMRKKWKGTLSDDFALTSSVRKAGLTVKFVPQALTPTIVEATFWQLFEFTNRQMKITRVYMPGLWIKSFTGAVLYCGVMISAVGIALSRQDAVSFWFSISTIFLVTLLSTVKAYLRLKAVSSVMTGHPSRLHSQFLPQLTLWAFTPFIFLVNCMVAAFSRTICWRGTRYEMLSPNETNILSNNKKC